MTTSVTKTVPSAKLLGACVEDDPTGKPRLTITLPDRAALDNLAQILAKLLAAAPADRAESER